MSFHVSMEHTNVCVKVCFNINKHANMLKTGNLGRKYSIPPFLIKYPVGFNLCNSHEYNLLLVITS